MVILIDTNVLLDVLQNRIPFIFFILRKNCSAGQRRLLLTGLLKIVRVSGIEHKSVVEALKREDFSDFEDCLQDECAKEIGADYIITRNINDFVRSEVPAITPKQFLEIME